MTPSFVGHFDACLGLHGVRDRVPLRRPVRAARSKRHAAQIERRHERTLGDRLFRSALFAVVPYPARLRVALAPLLLYRLRPAVRSKRSGLLRPAARAASRAGRRSRRR